MKSIQYWLVVILTIILVGNCCPVLCNCDTFVDLRCTPNGTLKISINNEEEIEYPFENGEFLYMVNDTMFLLLNNNSFNLSLQAIIGNLFGAYNSDSFSEFTISETWSIESNTFEFTISEFENTGDCNRQASNLESVPNSRRNYNIPESLKGKIEYNLINNEGKERFIKIDIDFNSVKEFIEGSEC